MRETCQEHDNDNGSESVSVGERHPPSTQTVTHTRRERERQIRAHTQCVWECQRRLWPKGPKGSYGKVKGTMPKAQCQRSKAEHYTPTHTDTQSV